jgi:2-polyprenyl-3-methyl-5-hydroxy-6-metoxy-1,4-benzoquinol methylase
LTIDRILQANSHRKALVVTACHICGSPDTERLRQEGAPFRLVSSDVQPVSGTVEFAFCNNCHAVQKEVTPAWQAMADRIYANYDINHQSLGAEPTIFDSAKGSGPRSSILLHNLLDLVPLSEKGRLLDIGCSNGNLLKHFHSLRPQWNLSGSELSDTWREEVSALPGVEAFYSGPDPAFAGPFDLISLSHVLEHIPNPGPFLKKIAGQLTEVGRILLAAPNTRQNPIDLVIADHCTHFDRRSLSYVAAKAGLAVEVVSTSLLPKELVAVLSRQPKNRGFEIEAAGSGASEIDLRELSLRYFGLLNEVRGEARKIVGEQRPFGIMGSSIAACWTMLELEGKADFFVDEDANRMGHELLGRPILGPPQVPSGAVVFIPMSVLVAEKIINRWKHLPIKFRYAPSNRPI